MFWFRLPPATKAPRGHPSPCRGVEENGKKTGRKLVGRDKGSLTEQQTEGTVTTTIQIRRKHNKNRPALSDRTGAARSQAARKVPLRRPPFTGTQRDVTWYGIPGSVWPGGVSPHPLAVPLPGVRWKLTLSWPNPGHYYSHKCRLRKPVQLKTGTVITRDDMSIKFCVFFSHWEEEIETTPDASSASCCSILRWGY